jgi:RNA polymerase sigma-B factor
MTAVAVHPHSGDTVTNSTSSSGQADELMAAMAALPAGDPSRARLRDISEEEVLEGLEGARAYNSASLDIPFSEDSTVTLGDTLGGVDDGFELAELRVALGPALAELDERQQKIISLRFYGNLTQTEIAERVGVSQMHVSRLLTRALAKLRRHLDIAGV